MTSTLSAPSKLSVAVAAATVVAGALWWRRRRRLRKKVVSLLDYGAGNVRSVRNAIQYLGYEVKDVTTVKDLKSAEILVFPGVGQFGSAMAVLEERGFVEPLRWYIEKSGRPFLGVCLGMQLLFEESEESPGVKGLGVIPGKVTRFSPQEADKGGKKVAVPQIGWNEYVAVKPSRLWDNALSRAHVYFVHSFHVKIVPALKDWVLTATDYAGLRYVSSVQKGPVCAFQFHPEKSGETGLRLLKAFLDAAQCGTNLDDAQTIAAPSASTVLARRIIACLDVRTNDQGDLVVTKGDSYDVREETKEEGYKGDGDKDGDGYTNTGQVRNLGKPVELAHRYFTDGADEITFLNICAFRSEPVGDLPLVHLLEAVSRKVYVPLCVGGGIRSYVDSEGHSVSAVDVASAYFRAGADKISIGSDAVYAAEKYYEGGAQSEVSAIEAISKRYGAQAVVLSVDPRRVWLKPGWEKNPPKGVAGPYTVITHDEARGPQGEKACWYQATVKGGREGRPIDAVQLAVAAERLGAGEVLLNCIDTDGKGTGFDTKLIAAVRAAVTVSIIASSGAGAPSHFVDVFRATDTEAALAAGIFHRREVAICDVKDKCMAAGLPIRS